MGSYKPIILICETFQCNFQSMNFNDFNYSFPLQMRWNDLDSLGHVNNAVYVTYFELARSRYMPTACPGWDWFENMFLIGSLQLTYHKEMRMGVVDPLVKVRTSSLGTKSFNLEYGIFSKVEDDYILHTSGMTTQIMFDMKTKQTIEIPDWVKENLKKFDNL